MKCQACGMRIEDQSQYCEHCGMKVIKDSSESPIEPIIEDEGLLGSSTKGHHALDLPQDIHLGQDGRYRWTYEMNMWKNPTLVLSLFKILMAVAMVPALLLFFLTLVEEGMGQALSVFVQVTGLVALILSGLLVIAYPIISIINGGVYSVVFEMDDQHIKHIQMQKQYKKNQVLAWLTVLAGLSAGSPQVAGAGLLAGSKQSSTSHFSKVKHLIIHKKRHVIYVNEALERNQIYAPKEAFEFVENHLVTHCKRAKVTIK